MPIEDYEYLNTIITKEEYQDVLDLIAKGEDRICRSNSRKASIKNILDKL